MENGPETPSNITELALSVGGLIRLLSYFDPDLPVRVAVSYAKLWYHPLELEFLTEPDFVETLPLLAVNMKLTRDSRSGELGLHLRVDGGVTASTAAEYMCEGRD